MVEAPTEAECDAVATRLAEAVGRHLGAAGAPVRA
jgi:hypothetical protein